MSNNVTSRFEFPHIVQSISIPLFIGVSALFTSHILYTQSDLPPLSSVSKDGVISKSGADAYYNYLIYIMSLTSEDEICSEPFNMAIQINFPHLYSQGYRLGFYREVPARQEDVSPQNRLNQQQS